MWRGCFGLKDDVAAHLVYDAIAPISAERFDDVAAASVARQLHQATATNSSRTKCSRIILGAGRSKWNAFTASKTLARSSAQSFPSVKMLSPKASATKPPSASWVTSKTSSFICARLCPVVPQRQAHSRVGAVMDAGQNHELPHRTQPDSRRDGLGHRHDPSSGCATS